MKFIFAILRSEMKSRVVIISVIICLILILLFIRLYKHDYYLKSPSVYNYVLPSPTIYIKNPVLTLEKIFENKLSNQIGELPADRIRTLIITGDVIPAR